MRLETVMEWLCSAFGGAAVALLGLDGGLRWPWLASLLAAGAVVTYSAGWVLDRWLVAGRDTP